mmetsp:Transcript_15341/g.45508  ORF Transcript_15341/g.45508 Transcript_15341/m.45508 type:complete len:239 (-) Transcript_15341:671-1387(-)
MQGRSRPWQPGLSHGTCPKLDWRGVAKWTALPISVPAACVHGLEALDAHNILTFRAINRGGLRVLRLVGRGMDLLDGALPGRARPIASLWGPSTGRAWSRCASAASRDLCLGPPRPHVPHPGDPPHVARDLPGGHAAELLVVLALPALDPAAVLSPELAARAAAPTIGSWPYLPRVATPTVGSWPYLALCTNCASTEFALTAKVATRGLGAFRSTSRSTKSSFGASNAAKTSRNARVH